MTRPLRNTLLALTFGAVALGTAPAAVAGNGGNVFLGFLAGATIATILNNQNNSSRRRYNNRSSYANRYNRGDNGRNTYVPTRCIHSVRTSHGYENHVDRYCLDRNR